MINNIVNAKVCIKNYPSKNLPEKIQKKNAIDMIDILR